MKTVFAKLLLPAVLVQVAGLPAAAQPSGQPDFSLTVGPSRVIVPAGQAGRPRQFAVVNHGLTSIDVVVGTASFTAGRDGNLVFRTDVADSAARWVSVAPDHFRLAAGAAEQVILRIALPASAEPGEHQVAVTFSVPAGSGAAGIGVSRSIGVPVYVTAPGAVVDAVEVVKLGAPGFVWGGPVNLSATVRNTGTIHRDFVGGDRLVARAADETVPFADFTLLRGARREVTAQWADPPLFCICRVAVSVVDPGGVNEERTATVIVLRPRLIGSAAAVLVLLLIAGWLWRRVRRRRPNRRALPDIPASVGAARPR